MKVQFCIPGAGKDWKIAQSFHDFTVANNYNYSWSGLHSDYGYIQFKSDMDATAFILRYGNGYDWSEMGVENVRIGANGSELV